MCRAYFPAYMSESNPLLHALSPALPGIELDLHGKPVIGLDDASLYRYGHLIRSTEQLILDLFSRGQLSGTTHTCLGQELCQMSVVRALNEADDVVLSNHRNHGHFLAYSGHFLGLITEIMGREAGACRGYGGSQHLNFRHFHSNGVQAGMTALGTGLALARKQAGSRGIVAFAPWLMKALSVAKNSTVVDVKPTMTQPASSGLMRWSGQYTSTNTGDTSSACPKKRSARAVSACSPPKKPRWLASQGCPAAMALRPL